MSEQCPQLPSHKRLELLSRATAAKMALRRGQGARPNADEPRLHYRNRLPPASLTPKTCVPDSATGGISYGISAEFQILCTLWLKAVAMPLPKLSRQSGEANAMRGTRRRRRPENLSHTNLPGSAYFAGNTVPISQSFRIEELYSLLCTGQRKLSHLKPDEG